MNSAVYVAPFGAFGDVRALVSLAQDAEIAGWDGFFIYDHIARPSPIEVVDPWIALSAVAMVTNRVRIGALVTPLARRRPAKVARETASLDRLSGGRLIVGAGLGHRPEEFRDLGEVESLVVRDQMVAEALDVVTGLWRGEAFSYSGSHFTVRNATFLPVPLQVPRIPIWIALRWPNPRRLLAATRWDGVFPVGRVGRGHRLQPDDIRDLRTFVAGHRGVDGFDIACLGTSESQSKGDQGRIEAFAAAGVTWWLEDISARRFGLPHEAGAAHARLRRRVLDGPVR